SRGAPAPDRDSRMATVACTTCEIHAESTFKVEGMDCREEVVLIERRFKHLAALEDFTADLMGQRLLVKYDAAKLSASTIAGAVTLGQWSEAGAVVLLFAVAQALEARTIERARNAVRGLMDLTPAEALVSDAAGERLVDVEQIAPGTVIVVKPGEKIPLDGEV